MQLYPDYLMVLAASVGVSALVGLVLALPALKLRDDYFLMATLAFGESIQDVLVAGDTWSGGSLGLRAIPGLEDLSRMPDGSTLILFALVVVVATYWMCRWIENSHFGLALRTVAENDSLSVTLGQSPAWLKTRALLVSGGTCGAAGSLLALYLSYIDPGFFGIQESVLVLAMVVVGGLGRRTGALVGAVTLTTLPDLLVFLDIPSRFDASIRQITYGMLLILIMHFRPKGLIGGGQVGGATSS